MHHEHPIVCTYRIEKTSQMLLRRAIESGQRKDVLLVELKILQTAFRSIQIADVDASMFTPETHPISQVLMAAWPSLHVLLTAWCADADIIDLVCEMLNSSIRNLLDLILPLLPALVQ